VLQENVDGHNGAGWELTPFAFQRQTEKWIKKRTSIVIRVRDLKITTTMLSINILSYYNGIECCVNIFTSVKGTEFNYSI